VLCSTEEIGIRVYRTPSFPTIMASKRVGRWHYLRCYIGIGAKPHCFGMRRESLKFWTRHTARSREISSYGGREHEDCVVEIKELCRP
jgi:hypothetical protein